MSLEERARNLLAKDLPGLRKCGLRQTMRDAYQWIYPGSQKTDDGIWTVGEMERVEEDWPRPPFIPDATRFRKCAFQHNQSSLTPCVEIWEIEDTNPITSQKLKDIETWMFWHWDGAMHPQFELWRTDRWGQGRYRILSTAEDHYGVKLINLP